MNPLSKWVGNTWQKIRAYFTDVNSEYRLVSKPLPELYKLKSAHQELFQAYAESLAAASRLTFFVKMTEVKPANEGRVIGVFHKIMWVNFSPLRLLIWRPIVNLYLQAHIYNKMKELEAAYSIASFLPQSTMTEDKKTQEWFIAAKGDCQRLLATVGTGKLLRETINFLLLVTLNFLLAVWGANSYSEFIVKIFTSTPPADTLIMLGKVFVFIMFMLPFSLAFIDAAFSVKRAIFSNINAHKDHSKSIYELESILFEFLASGKSKEFPVDLGVIAFFYTVLILIIWLFHLFITESAKYTNTRICDISWCLLLPFLAMFLSEVITPWIRRARNGEM